MKYRKTARPLALLVAALLACQPVTAMAVTFADINQVPWPGAETSINKAANLGLVVGETINGKSYFRPRDTVSLSESCQFAYKVLLQTKKASADASITEKWKTVLNTYKIQDWAHPAVSFCLEEGIISISDLGSFVKNGSNMPASREQAAEILGRALTVGVPSYTATASNTAFNDNASIASDARPYIALLNEKGIVNGDENKNFNPKKTLNRTETAVMVTNLYEKLNGAASAVTPSAPATSTVSGTVKDLNTHYVNFDGSAAYYLYSSSGISATLNGDSSSIDALVTLFKDGTEMKATLTLDGNTRITKLAVTAEEEESDEKLTEGELTKVVYDDEDGDGSITIEKNSTYRIDDVDDVDIEIDDEEIDFEELYDLYKECKDEGDVIEVELTFDRNDDVSKIIGEVKGSSGSDGDVEGDVTDVDYDEEDDKGTIEIDDDDEYEFDDDTDIEIDGDSADWEDLLDAFEDAEDNDEVLEAVLTLDEDDDEYCTDIEIFTEDYEDDDKDEDEEEYEGEIEKMTYDYDDEEGTIEVDGEEFEAPNPEDVDIEITDGDDEIDNWEDLYAAFEFDKTIEVTLVAEGDEVISIEGKVTAVKGQLVDFSYESLEIEVEAELDDDDVTEEYEYFFTEHENDEDDDDEYEDWEDDLKDIDVDIDGLRNVADMLEFYDWLYDDGDEVDLDDEDITITLELNDDGMIVKVTGDRD